MIKFFSFLILLSIISFPQSDTISFHSHENIKKFADYLFCEGDYLRAAEEYDKISAISDDTVNYKMMLCYSELGLFQSSNLKYNFYPNSNLTNDADKLFIKNLFLTSPDSFYKKTNFEFYPFRFDSISSNYIKKMASISHLYSSVEDKTKYQILNPFMENEEETISTFYDLKKDPPYKSLVLAGVSSAIIPGSGKMYVGEWGDGITALLVTSLFAFLAYDNFKADHQTRAWIFTGVGAFFYGGNIYGSIASAQIFNARVDFEFNDGLKLYLEQINYFLHEYDFCK